MNPSSRDLSLEEKKAQFRKAAITHRLLQQTDRTIMRAIGEPAGFAFLLVHGPTGVGKTKMIEILSERIKQKQPAPPVLPFASWFHQTSVLQVPLLVLEARPTDGSAFNRAYYYRTLLSLMGERTYPQQIQVDIHAETDPPKRRKVTGKAAQFNDLPELREAAEDAIRRHGVRVIIVDEAHHMMYTGSGGPTVTLQEQLEWLKSMSNTTGALHILVGTYDVFNFGRLNGQLARRCLPVHFPRYLLQREEDCIEFQAALLAFLRKVPLRCDAETLVGSYWCDSSQALATKKRKDWPQKCSCHAQIFEKKSLGKAQTLTESTRFAQRLANTWSGTACMKMQKGQAFGLTSVSHPQEQRTRFPEVCPRRPILLTSHNWVYFYEGCIGCIGVLKDWLMRAVSTALDEGQDTLSLDCLQDHALPTDICRQMALDAYEGEQKLKYTESNREHLWRLLQGGELIAPVPPLPPRGMPPTPSPAPAESATRYQDDLAQPPPSSEAAEARSPAPKSKKTRSRKMVEALTFAQEPGSSIQAEGGEAPVLDPPKQRRRKTRNSVVEAAELGVQAPSSMKGEEASESSPVGAAVSPTKPKRTRRVGEPKPKRYVVGEKTAAPNGG